MWYTLFQTSLHSMVQEQCSDLSKLFSAAMDCIVSPRNSCITLFLLKSILFLLFSVWVFCMSVYYAMYHNQTVFWRPIRWISWNCRCCESYHVGAGKWTRVFWKNDKGSKVLYCLFSPMYCSHDPWNAKMRSLGWILIQHDRDPCQK